MTLRRLVLDPWREGPPPVHTLLIAAYPILFLYGQNLGELRLAHLGGPLVAMVAVALVALLLAATLVRDARRAALVLSVIVVALSFYGHAAGLARETRIGTTLQNVGWAALILGAVVVAVVAASRHIAALTRLLNLVSGVLVVLTLVTIVPVELGRLTRNNAQAGPVVSADAGAARDIYYIVFDRYGSARSLDLLYGVDDEPFLDGLRDRGFDVLADSHANYQQTILSLGATLNLDYLDEIAAAQGPASNDLQPVLDQLSGHAVGRFLVGQGYDYVHVGGHWGPTQTSALTERNLIPRGPSDFLAALDQASALPTLRRWLGISNRIPELERHFEGARFQLDTLDGLTNEPEPTFVFAHLLLPHPPYVFTPDGSFVSAEAGAARTEAEAFEQQLTYLHGRVNGLVDRLLDRPVEDQPIIILQADEGPYPASYVQNQNLDWANASPDDVEAKFGIFNAMFLPGDEAAPAATMSSVNTFRYLFGRYFGADLPLLPDRSYASAAKARPYDFVEITDRLPSLQASR